MALWDRYLAWSHISMGVNKLGYDEMEIWKWMQLHACVCMKSFWHDCKLQSECLICCTCVCWVVH